jgi:hypothetical protein
MYLLIVQPFIVERIIMRELTISLEQLPEIGVWTKLLHHFVQTPKIIKNYALYAMTTYN